MIFVPLEIEVFTSVRDAMDKRITTLLRSQSDIYLTFLGMNPGPLLPRSSATAT